MADCRPPLLRGFLIAGSSYGKELFSLEAVVQPLYVPAEYALSVLDQRLGTWDLADQNEADAMAEVSARIRTEGLPSLRRFEEPSDVAAYAGSDLRPMTPFADEAIAYSVVLVDDLPAARAALVTLIQEAREASNRRGRERDKLRADRAARVLAALDTGKETARELLWQWRGETLRALRLEEFV